MTATAGYHQQAKDKSVKGFVHRFTTAAQVFQVRPTKFGAHRHSFAAESDVTDVCAKVTRCGASREACSTHTLGSDPEGTE